ncbi:MAG TPA: helix-turn-helix transcriptional regulator [Gallicola sp.]|nr:helix-turn-helix transcriptional regulator [Gallicola sp.]
MQEKLLILRKRKNITQTQMAKLINISVKQYGEKERGKAKFNSDEMFAIANLLGENIEDIFLPTTHQNGEKTIEN